MWKKLGINYDDISLGDNAGLFSPLEGFSPENKERVERFVEEIYTRFKECVAKGRKMSPETAESVAKGRVWMADKALELGLVDRIGGFEAAIDEARKLMDVPADAPIRLRSYPRDPSIFKTLLGSRNSLDQQKVSSGVWNTFAGAFASIPLIGRSVSTFIRAALLFSRSYSALAASPEVGAFVNAVKSGALVAQEPAVAMVETPLIL
jgi:ClpP class serine protease